MLDAHSFSYASPDQNPFQQFFIRLVEKLTGQIRIWRLYHEYTQENPATRDDFWNASLRKLDLGITYNTDGLDSIPQTGPVVVVANHPYGVLDGLIITHLIKKVRSDFRVLTNSVLCQAPEAQNELLPIDFSQTEEALKINLQTRKQARQILKDGGCIVVFPAGGVSTIPTWKDKVAQDTAWQPFIARLIQEAQADVVPLFFEGQNSRLFQLVSLCSPTLRLSLFFKEVADKIGTHIGVVIGKPLSFETLRPIRDREALCHHLREQTYALGGMTTLPPPKPAYRSNPYKKETSRY